MKILKKMYVSNLKENKTQKVDSTFKPQTKRIKIYILSQYWINNEDKFAFYSVLRVRKKITEKEIFIRL